MSGKPNSDLDLIVKLLADKPELINPLSKEVKKSILAKNSGRHFELTLQKL